MNILNRAFLLSMLIGLTCAGNAMAARDATDQELLRTEMVGPKILREIGVNAPQDIRAVTLTCNDGCYRITWEDNRATIERLYNALHGGLGFMPNINGTPQSEGMALDIAGGSTAVFAYGLPESGSGVELSLRYFCNGLLPVLAAIRTDPEAPQRGAALGPWRVTSLEFKTADAPALTSVPSPPPAASKAVLTLLDCLDPRRSACQCRTESELQQMLPGCTAVALNLGTPAGVMLGMQAPGRGPDANYPDPYRVGKFRLHVDCDRVVILRAPTRSSFQVGFRVKGKAAYYIDDTYLGRREDEARRVKQGKPGHPLTDTDYYRSVEDVWKDLLQALSREGAAKD